MKIDLMGSLPLTEAEIQARTQDTIEGVWPTWKRERALRMAIAGYPAQSGALDSYMADISAEVDIARSDSALLTAVLDYEGAIVRLALPILDGHATIDGEAGPVPNPELLQDAAERAHAQLIIDGASRAVIDLVTLRIPPPLN